jgi:hypothetical protein
MSDLSDVTTDELIAELEGRGVVNDKHTAELRLADFSMKHTLRCHPDLFNCLVHKAVEGSYLNNGGLSPVDPGTYTLDYDEKTNVIRYEKVAPAKGHA